MADLAGAGKRRGGSSSSNVVAAASSSSGGEGGGGGKRRRREQKKATTTAAPVQPEQDLASSCLHLANELECYWVPTVDDAEEGPLVDEAVQALRRLIKVCNRLLTGDRSAPVIIRETYVSFEQAVLTPCAATIFANQDMVDNIACYILDGKRNFTKDINGVRATCRQAAMAFSAAVKQLTGRLSREYSGHAVHLIGTFPNVESLALKGRGKPATDVINSILDTISERTKPLKELAFYGQSLNKTIIKRITLMALTPQLSSFERLTLHYARMDVSIMKDLLAAWKKGGPNFLPRLKALDLSMNSKLNDQGIAELMDCWEASGVTLTLEYLDFRCMRMGNSGFMRIVHALRNGCVPNLKVLLLGVQVDRIWDPNTAASHCLIEMARAFELACATQLEILHLQQYPWTPEVAKAFISTIKAGYTPNLQELGFGGGRVSNEEGEQLMKEGLEELGIPLKTTKFAILHW